MSLSSIQPINHFFSAIQNGSTTVIRDRWSNEKISVKIDPRIECNDREYSKLSKINFRSKGFKGIFNKLSQIRYNILKDLNPSYDEFTLQSLSKKDEEEYLRSLNGEQQRNYIENLK